MNAIPMDVENYGATKGCTTFDPPTFDPQCKEAHPDPSPNPNPNPKKIFYQMYQMSATPTR